LRISFLQPRGDDDADFSIKVRSDERQRQLSARAETRDYWKIPIRPGGQLAAFSDHAAVDPLALEEAASADGLQVFFSGR